ncbi:MAG: hypothetical protein OEV42_02495 [Deltaproteobacteria bacterium]|nr:hypothetical protein [Deltaproteobacteria bacterium]
MERRKSRFFISLFLGLTLSLFFLPLPSKAIEGLPGANWVFLSHDIHGLTGSGGMGWIQQGIDWVKLPGNIMVNTYAEYSVRDRTKKEDYYDVRGPSVGLNFEKSYFDLGVNYYWLKYPELERKDKDEEGYEVTFGWYYTRDLKAKDSGFFVMAFPFSTWGKLSHDGNGITGSSAMGWIQQGIDWFTLPGGIMVDTYLKYSYRGRTKEEDYFNSQGPSVGLEFSKSYFKAGISYYWEEYPKLNERQDTAQYYFGWYYYWDLMEK